MPFKVLGDFRGGENTMARRRMIEPVSLRALR
jgi:hypothetical protein